MGFGRNGGSHFVRMYRGRAVKVLDLRSTVVRLVGSNPTDTKNAYDSYLRQ